MTPRPIMRDMSFMPNVETDVPLISIHHQRTSSYDELFGAMKIGDSFSLPPAERSRFSQAATKYRRAHPSFAFTCRVEKMHRGKAVSYRLWRVAPEVAIRRARKSSSPRGESPNSVCNCRYLDADALRKIAAARGYVRAGRGALGTLAKKHTLYGPKYRSAETAIIHDTSGRKAVSAARIQFIAERLGVTPLSISKPFTMPHARHLSGTKYQRTLKGMRSFGPSNRKEK